MARLVSRPKNSSGPSSWLRTIDKIVALFTSLSSRISELENSIAYIMSHLGNLDDELSDLNIAWDEIKDARRGKTDTPSLLKEGNDPESEAVQNSKQSVPRPKKRARKN